MSNQFQLFKQINTIVLDCDGVLTNSQLLIPAEGELLRSMTVRDGYAIKRAVAHGIRIAVITGGSSKGVENRLRALGIHHYFPGVDDKKKVFDRWVQFHEIDTDRILYMGDDLPDLEPMMQVGLPTCPADAVPEIIEISKYVSPIKGGAGCVRDVIEKILKLQGGWIK